MTKQIDVKLTDAEINHLLTLIQWNEAEGTYYGNKEQYNKRIEVIKNKLKQ
tara:strand:- start:80 stop:232 length:153 start_codon:yes stop_codon:yes gene_type:complete